MEENNDPVMPEPGTAASMDRTVLPVPEPQYPPITELDAQQR